MALFTIVAFVIVVAPLDALYPQPNGVPADIKYRHKYPPRGPLGGWNILNPSFLAEGREYLDASSFEWDYFMIHDDQRKFDGIVGMVLCDPRGKGKGIMPSGGNIAVVGQLNGRTISNFENWGLAVDASAVEAYMHCPKGQGERPTSWGIESIASTDPPTIRLQGEMQDMIYDLHVSQDWTEREGLNRKKGPSDVVAQGPFAPMTATDIGSANDGETWTVNMFWPRTKVIGTMTDTRTNESFPINGHGYRENSFGQWFFADGGWDFAIFSDAKSGVQWNWQSYYTISPAVQPSAQGTTLDVSFIEPHTKELRAVQFSGGQLGWEVPSWKFRHRARQCTPLSVVVTAANDELEVVMNITIGNEQAAMLSDATPLVKDYVINEWFPDFDGMIRRKNESNPLVRFAGIGGGEVSMLRNLFPWLPEFICDTWSQSFRKPLLESGLRASELGSIPSLGPSSKGRVDIVHV